MEYTMIDVKMLDHSPQNARRTTTAKAAEDLKASIFAHGLMQNLVVTKAGGGRYRVIAGGRRLTALCELQAEGALRGDHTVPCRIADDDHAPELSLAENTVRQAMHPADEFEAFARLIADGRTVAEVAERFGVGRRHVEQRLKLGRLAPELLAAYREGALTLDALMAFTITDDHGKQREVYASLRPWQAADADDIRAALTGEMAEASSKLARFVGLDAYHAAGGQSRGDLFGDGVYLEDPGLLNRLADDKLEGVRLQLEAEGWGWVEVSPDRDWGVISNCRRIHPQQVDVPQEVLARRSQIEAEMESLEEVMEDTESEELSESYDRLVEQSDEIDEQIASFVAYDPRQMPHAGCYVSIDRGGAIAIEKGLVRSEDARLILPGERRSARPKGAMPDPLRRDLEACRQQAAQLELARHRLVALDLLIFTVARSVLGHSYTGPLDVRPGRQRPAVKEPTGAEAAFEATQQSLPLSWLRPETEGEQFRAFIALPDAQKLDLLAWCVASCLKPQLATGHEDTAWEMALSLTDADMADYWRPTRDNYLGRVSRDRLLAIGRELLGEPWAQSRSRDKKSELAGALERAFTAPGSVPCTQSQREALTRWLPDGMAFGRTPPPLASEAAAVLNNAA
ncbi:ParB/RepB/Spo0J family partition protein [Singulisphaera sp. PoT]|uniref:ParB/RepB/Spo0J family partition protein n=1 Tax=Singulisphaera sp. PoT TaxID=3411797 RepID=UPI003BF4A3D9